MSNTVVKIGGLRHDKLFPGCKNHAKYPNIPGKFFCGTKPGTYPVDTIEHARAALMLAHYDPHPAKVRSCALKPLNALKKAAEPKPKPKATKTKK